MKRLLLLILIALYTGNSYSQERLLAWQFSIDSRNTTGQEETHLATSLHPALSGSILKRGGGLAPSSSTLARAFAASANTSVIPNVAAIPTTQTDAETKNTYLEFELSSRVGYKLALSEIRAQIRRTGTGYNGYIWKYLLNGGDANLNGGTEGWLDGGTLTKDHTGDGDLGTPVSISLSTVTALQNLSSNDRVVFRLYVWGATATAGTIAFGRGTANDATYFPLAVHGTATPEPEKTLLGFDLANETGLQETSNATTVHSNINLSTLTRGAGLVVASSGIRHSIASNLKDYNETTNNRPTLNDAIDQDDYYQFTVSAKPGNIFSLSSLDVTLRRSSIGTVNYQWRYSLDGSSFFNVGDAGKVQFEATLGFAQPSINLSGVSELQNIADGTTVTLRLYVWGATGSTGGSISIGRYDNVAGTTTVVANSLALGGSVTTVTPVKLTSFTAKPPTNSVQLKWSTASETNNSHFEVLRSNGEGFKTIGTVKGNGNATVVNHYQYTDRQPLAGVSYYQLRQVDYNGDTELSDVVTVKNQLSLQNTEVYASLQQQKVTVNFFAEKTGTASLSITDLTGRKIAVKNVLAEGNKSNSAAIEGVLKKGVYLLGITLNGEIQHKKFIVQ